MRSAGTHNSRLQAVFVGVAFPHLDEVFRTQNKCADAARLFKHPGQRRRHDGLAQAHHITDQHAAAFLEVVRGEFYGGALVGQQLKILRDVVIAQS